MSSEMESPVSEGLLEASRLVESGESHAALQLLLDLEREQADDATLLCMIGVVADELGAEGMAADYYRRCLALDPTDPELLVRAGVGLLASADPAAEPALRLAALTAPGMMAARMHYGSFLVRSGLIAEGVDELIAARDLDPEDAAARRALARGYLMAGREGDATEELEVAVSLDPDDAETRLLLALVTARGGDWNQVAEELFPAASALEDDGEAQLVLAAAFGLAGWLEEAWLALSRAESAPVPADPDLVREIEEVLETDAEALRSLLVDEIGASMLRDRIYRF